MIDTEVQPHDGWFTFEDLPLKWHYPVGLLYDLFSGAEPIYPPDGEHGQDTRPIRQTIEKKEDVTALLPWKLVVHFTEWPEDQLIKLDSEGKVLQDAFINGVKEVAHKLVLGDSMNEAKLRCISGRLPP